MRALTALSGVALAAAAVAGPWFRDPGGALSASACLPLGGAVALWILAVLPPARFGRAGAWLALAALGQAAILQLMRAGAGVGHQHLSVPWQWSLADAPAIAIVAAQSAAVALAGRGLPGRALAWARTRLPGWRLWVVATLFVLTAATVSADPRIYAAELALATYLQALLLATIVLAARALPDSALARVRAVSDRWLGDAERSAPGAPPVPSEPPAAGAPSTRGPPPAPAGPLRPDRFAWLAAAWVFVVAAGLAVFVYGRHPHVPDEVGYLFHAKYLAEGRLWLDPPPVEEAFGLRLVALEGDRWYSPVPPAWPAVLAIGVRLGAPHLVNPLLGAFCVLLAYGVLGSVYGRRTARIAVALLATSPWFLFLAMSFMTHMLSTAAALGAAWCVARLRVGGPAWWAVPGGIGIGLVGMTRPLEGLVVAGLLGLWALGSPGRLRFAIRAARVAGLALVTLATSGLGLAYNRLFTGDPLTFPLMAYTDRVFGAGTNALGFGPDRGWGWTGLDPFHGHDLLDVLINGNLNLHGVNVELLGWGIGSLLVVLLGALAPRRERGDAWMMGAAGAIIGVHSFYWFSGGPDFGARYWFLVLVPLLALAARGIEWLGAELGSGGAARVRFAALGLAVLTVTTFLPWRSLDKYRGYRGMQPGMRALASEVDFGRGLVLVRGSHFPDYSSAAIYNPTDLAAPVPVYAYDASPEVRRAVVAAFPDRPVWVVDGPQRTGVAYAVVAGPLPPGTVPSGP